MTDLGGDKKTGLPRYISPEKLIDIINPNGVGDPLVRLQDIMRAIAVTPTADVAPVVHGHWLFINGHLAPMFKCSNCRNIAFNSLYCPNCGAKMDEEMAE